MAEVSRKVGRYELLGELGRGGMAIVYLARQPGLDRLVALKELRSLQLGDSASARRFLREARLAGSLNHPNIVTVHDYFEDGGLPFIAMEYMERGSLRPYVTGLSVAEIGGVLEGLLSGLAAAEQHSIVHRDLKPENVLVTKDGRVKIGDFGIAKATDALQSTAHLTLPGTTVGTPNYIAPEQAMGRSVGPWTDLYSVGVIAFELFVGRPPFGDTEDPIEVVQRQVDEAVPPVIALVPGVDPGLSDWVGWLVSKSPSERPQSAAEARDALEERLIALLGPRWRRAGLLLDPTERALLTLGPATPPPVDAPLGPLTAAEIEDFVAAAAEPPLPLTVAPQTVRHDDPAPDGPAGKPRGRPRGLKALFAGVAVIALLAAVLGGRNGAPVPETTASSPAAQTPAQTTNQGDAPEGDRLASQAEREQALASYYAALADTLETAGGAKAAVIAEARALAAAYRNAAVAATRGDTATHDARLAVAESRKRQVDGDLARLGIAAPQRPNGTRTAPAPSGSSSDDERTDVGDSESDDPSDDQPDG